MSCAIDLRFVEDRGENDDGIVVDLFAGGGGASTGIEAALGRPVAIAVNHSENAIAMHERNHPNARHYREDVWKVKPREACAGRRVKLLWLSPACTHFSKAKGGQNPKSAKIRSLASVAIVWAREVKPDVIMLENVEEFLDWGPLDHEGKPIKSKKGHSFNRWVGKLRAQGYVVEWRKLVAADYGAPTTRKRLFLIARHDGKPIVWPEPTHGPGRAQPWRTAAECIDWSIPARSIFDRKKPLAEATLRRIAAGVMRYVVQNPKPFIVKFHGGDERNLQRAQPLTEPLRTVDTENRFAVVDVAVASPMVVPVTHTKSGDRVHDSAEPLRTVTTARGGEFALVSPTIIPVTHQGGDRACSAQEPLRTVTAAHRGEMALVSAHVTKFHEGSVGIDARAPLPTVTANSPHGRPGGAVPLGVVSAELAPCEPSAPLVLNNMNNNVPRPVDQPIATLLTGNHKFLVTPTLTKLYGSNEHGAPVEAPAPTITAGGSHIGIAAATLVQTGYGEREGQQPRALDIEQPLGTVVAGGAKHAQAVALLKHYGGVVGQPIDQPTATVTQKDHHALLSVTLGADRRDQVRAFIVKYYKGGKSEPRAKGAKGKRSRKRAQSQQSLFADPPASVAAEREQTRAQGQEMGAPLHTITTRDRFALVTVDGVDYEIVDIGMRMLDPRELWRAQGFPEGLDVSGFTKSQQIELCGNSVCPPVAEALVRANFQSNERTGR